MGKNPHLHFYCCLLATAALQCVINKQKSLKKVSCMILSDQQYHTHNWFSYDVRKPITMPNIKKYDAKWFTKSLQTQTGKEPWETKSFTMSQHLYCRRQFLLQGWWLQWSLQHVREPHICPPHSGCCLLPPPLDGTNSSAMIICWWQHQYANHSSTCCQHIALRWCWGCVVTGFMSPFLAFIFVYLKTSLFICL